MQDTRQRILMLWTSAWTCWRGAVFFPHMIWTCSQQGVRIQAEQLLLSPAVWEEKASSAFLPLHPIPEVTQRAVTCFMAEHLPCSSARASCTCVCQSLVCAWVRHGRSMRLLMCVLESGKLFANVFLSKYESFVCVCVCSMVFSLFIVTDTACQRLKIPQKYVCLYTTMTWVCSVVVISPA